MFRSAQDKERNSKKIAPPAGARGASLSSQAGEAFIFPEFKAARLSLCYRANLSQISWLSCIQKNRHTLTHTRQIYQVLLYRSHTRIYIVPVPSVAQNVLEDWLVPNHTLFICTREQLSIRVLGQKSIKNRPIHVRNRKFSAPPAGPLRPRRPSPIPQHQPGYHQKITKIVRLRKKSPFNYLRTFMSVQVSLAHFIS